MRAMTVRIVGAGRGRRWRAAIAAWLLLPLSAAPAAEPPPLPAVASGRIERLVDFPSRHVPSRPVDVWLPMGYPAQAPYAVLYMHDGQMLFDAGLAWNRQEWRVDEVAGDLLRSGRLRPFIVVGIWNAGAARAAEYFPQAPLQALAPPQRDTLWAALGPGGATRDGNARSDAYLRFLVTELKPYVEAHFAVSARREDSFVAGSSLGALVSLYAVAEYPDVFGGAACLSTHWTGWRVDGPDNPVPAALLRYLERRLPAAGRHRFWFDHGTETLDAGYGVHQARVDALMRARGYARTAWQTRVYTGAAHDEAAWAERLDQPLLFLLRK